MSIDRQSLDSLVNPPVINYIPKSMLLEHKKVKNSWPILRLPKGRIVIRE